MPRIIQIPLNHRSNTVTIQLDKEGLVVDNRSPCDSWVLECSIEGTTLTVTRGDTYNLTHTFYVRVYDPDTEDVPDFASKSYRYHGLENERAPYDVTEVIVDPSVTVIRKSAFYSCRKMKRCVMGNRVQRIQKWAFRDCDGLRRIRLSRSLTYIGDAAFRGCDSIDWLYIPPDVEDIRDQAFYSCKGMKVLILPVGLDTDRMGYKIALDCPKLLITNDYGSVQYGGCEERRHIVNREVNLWLKNHCYLPPLLRLCTDPDITAQMIQEFIRDNGTASFFHPIVDNDDDHGLFAVSVLPLHILARYDYTHTREDVIMTCYHANPFALITPDAGGMTPLDYLWENDGWDSDGVVNLIVHLIHDLLINRVTTLSGHEQNASTSTCSDGESKKRKRDIDGAGAGADGVEV